MDQVGVVYGPELTSDLVEMEDFVILPVIIRPQAENPFKQFVSRKD